MAPVSIQYPKSFVFPISTSRLGSSTKTTPIIGSSPYYSDPADKRMANLCIEPPMDSRACASALFCPCIFIGKVHWQIKQKELNQDPLQFNWKHKDCCNSPCYLSIFCLCPCFVAKYSSYVRSLYAISAKKYDKILSYICCSCVLLEIDREIRAREGEKRLRTNQSYNLNPVLTQPELSLPMKYISPSWTRAVPENSHVHSRKNTIKLKAPSVLTKGTTVEKTPESRTLILRDVFSYNDSWVGQPCGADFEVPKCNLRKCSNLKLTLPRHQSRELPGNPVIKTEAELNSIMSCDNIANSDPSQDKIDPVLSSSHNTFKGRMDIIEANQNSHTKELCSSSSFMSQVPQNYSKSSPHTKDDEAFISAKSSRQKTGLTRANNSTKFNITQDLYNKKLALFISEPESSAVCDRCHKKDAFSAPLMPIIDLTRTFNHSLAHPVLIPRTTGLHHLDVVENVNNQSHEMFVTRLDHDAPTESPNSMDYENLHSTSVAHTPKIKISRKSQDLISASFTSGIYQHDMGRSSVSKRSLMRSQPLNLQDMTDYFINYKASMSDEENELLTDHPKLDSNADIKKPVGFQSKNIHDDRSHIRNLDEKSQIREFRSSSPSVSRLKLISKLPIRINRDNCKSQSFSRPRLSPILSSEKIYRSRERDSEFDDFPSLLRADKEPKNYHDGQNLKDSLYFKSLTNKISTNFVIHNSNYLELISSTKLPLKPQVNRPIFFGRSDGKDKFKEENSVTKDQAAQRALKLILISSSGGIK